VRSCSGLRREPERPEWEFLFELCNRSGKPVWNAADSVHSRFDVVKFQAVHKSYTISICSAVHRVSIGQGSTLPAGRSECAQFMSHGRANTVLRCEEKKMGSPPPRNASKGLS